MLGDVFKELGSWRGDREGMGKGPWDRVRLCFLNHEPKNSICDVTFTIVHSTQGMGTGGGGQGHRKTEQPEMCETLYKGRFL